MSSPCWLAGVFSGMRTKTERHSLKSLPRGRMFPRKQGSLGGQAAVPPEKDAERVSYKQMEWGCLAPPDFRLFPQSGNITGNGSSYGVDTNNHWVQWVGAAQGVCRRQAGHSGLYTLLGHSVWGSGFYDLYPSEGKSRHLYGVSALQVKTYKWKCHKWKRLNRKFRQETSQRENMICTETLLCKARKLLTTFMKTWIRFGFPWWNQATFP